MAELLYDTKHSSLTLEKAEDGEPIFILRAQDESAPGIISLWLAMNPQVSYLKRNRAIATKEAMSAWPKKKKAD